MEQVWDYLEDAIYQTSPLVESIKFCSLITRFLFDFMNFIDYLVLLFTNLHQMPNYDSYNREERAICSHLFRLLHESLGQKEMSPLGKFLKMLLNQDLIFKNGTPSFDSLSFDNVAIYCEMALIRDAYWSKKDDRPGLDSFMDNLTRIIVTQENVNHCRLYSEMPKPLNDVAKTHPKQIRQKSENLKIELTENERKVYGAMQGMFNAKPDLVITIDNLLLVCEAKFTEPFYQEQMKRTSSIAEVWSKLLFKDLGFQEAPIYTVFKLGAKKYNPDISWQDVNGIVLETYDVNDRTRIAITSGIELLQKSKLIYS